jgi:hypothetical protein
MMNEVSLEFLHKTTKETTQEKKLVLIKII